MMGGPQGQSRQVWKMLPPPEYDPQNVQPIAGWYIFYTIQAHYMAQQVLKQKFPRLVSASMFLHFQKPLSASH